MYALNSHVTPFEGHGITTFHWDGRHAWVAREVARAIGYGNQGRGLVDDITNAWSDDFLPGVDYDLLSGPDLDAFRIVNPDGSPFRPARSGHGLFILYESGLHLALVRADRPAARRLRRCIVDEVLPGVVAPTVVPLAASEPQVDRRHRFTEREERRRRQLDLDDRSFRVSALHRTTDTLRELGRLDGDQLVLLEVSACEIALGFPLIHLYPPPLRDAVAAALGVPVDADSEEPAAAAA